MKLRSFKETDAIDVFECWESDPEVEKYMFWTSHNDINKTKEWIDFELGQIPKELKPDEVWYIGDQYECDVKGSLNTGLLPIWYIGAIALPYTEDISILIVINWEELRLRMEEYSK